MSNKYLTRSPEDKLYYPMVDVFNISYKMEHVRAGDLYWEIEGFFKSKGVTNINRIRGQIKALLLRYDTNIVSDSFHFNKHILKKSLVPVMKNIERDYRVRASWIEVSNSDCKRKMEIEPFGFNTKRLVSIYDREKKISYDKLVDYR
ncbi:hypothetical protein [Terrisporobacter petrolearius]|uniref:hypothetical protein n=1 Tax=Terrisporobacter petrolearius TaxID=1460447 RepID=UPI0022DFF6A0|nr:hypothetical protein [Terrisporobacter petrolearius]